MNSRRHGWLLGSSLLLAAAGCDVSIGHCDRDAGCFDDHGFFDDVDAGHMDGGKGDAGPTGDGGDNHDAGSDAGPETGDGGGGDAGSDAGTFTGEPLMLSEFCEAYQQRRVQWASAIEGCCMENPAAHGVEANIVLDVFGPDDGANGCITKHRAFIDNQTVVFHPDKAGACADAFLAQYAKPPSDCPQGGFDSEQLRATLAHGSQLIQQLPACRAALEGTVPEGSPCSDAIECANGNRCLPGVGQQTTCQKPIVANGTTGQCGKTAASCADGTICVGNNDSTRFCTPVGSLNQTISCSFSRECVQGSYCSVEASSVGGTCVTYDANKHTDDFCPIPL